jgi:hypothetical protein
MWIYYSLVIFLLRSYVVDAQNPFSCLMAPNPAFQMICHELQQWDLNARQFIDQQQQQEANTVINAPAVPQEPWLSPAVPQPFNPSPYACMDLGCVCSYMRGLGGPGGTMCFK